MQVAFWSTVHGQTATTSNTLILTLMTALEYRFKILITHNHYKRSTLETSILNKRYLKTELTELNDTGIDALSRFIKFNTVDKESISSYTTTLLENRLDLLMGTTHLNRQLYLSDLNMVIETILQAAKHYYDLLFIDVAAGDNELSNRILSSSDLIVINLSQNLYILEDFFNNNKHNLEKCIFLISMYDASSRYNLKTIKRKYMLKDKVATIPYCRAFSDACNEGKAIDFFMKNINVDKNDHNYNFINEARKAVQLLFSSLGIDLSLKKLGE